MKALLLAAGYATRLYPLTLNKPKALLPIGGQPIIDYILDKIKRVKEIDEVFVVTNHKFYEHFKKWADGRRGSFTVSVIDDGTLSNDDRLGAIGDIEFTIRRKAIKEDLLVVGADNIFDAGLVNFIKFSAAKKAGGCVGLYDLADRKLATQYGVVSIDASGKVIDFQEKPQFPKSTFVSTCIYYFPAQKLKMFRKYLSHHLKVVGLSSASKSKDASGNYIMWLSKNDSVYGYVLSGRWYDIGDMKSYKKANTDYSSSEPRTK